MLWAAGRRQFSPLYLDWHRQKSIIKIVLCEKAKGQSGGKFTEIVRGLDSSFLNRLDAAGTETLKKAVIDRIKCFGCGMRRSACIKDVIRLEPRANVPAVANLW